jgi:hypothetical protein
LLLRAGLEDTRVLPTSHALHLSVCLSRTAGDQRACQKQAPDWRKRLLTTRCTVSEDDLRAIAKRGYEGAVTTDRDQQAQAIGLFLSDTLLQI